MKDKPFCNPHLADHEPAFTVLRGRRLPDIPRPSACLQNLLCQYQFHEMNTKETQTNNKRPMSNPKGMRKRKINGFIAFRSFYSKTIKGASHQMELSSKLAAIWKEMPHRQTWNCYALQYNATGGEETFVNWLNRNLGFVSEFDEDKGLKTYKNQMLRNVEDVFFENNDFS